MRPEAVAGEVRRAVREVVPTVAVAKVTTMTDQVDASMIPERLIAMLSGFFGALGALLAAVGLYGLLAYTVARRTREIGIRMALGATHGDVMRMVLGSALGLAGTGLAIGLPLAFWSQRIATAFVNDLPAGDLTYGDVFKVMPAGDGLPLVGAAAAMIVVALVAAFVPASRAARVSPIESLRQE